MRTMKILVLSDSFKGSLSSLDIGQIIQEELRPEHLVDFLPVSDGGEGFLESWQAFFNGSIVKQQIPDPLFREIEAGFLLTDQQTAIIESAKVCGLELLRKEERNPLHTSTFGLGKIIQAAIQKGAREIYLGLGGSATNDGGMGLLQALGGRFLDSNGQEIQESGGIALQKVHKIEFESISHLIQSIKFYGICDVRNPLLGPQGATKVYGPQKGATPDHIQLLESGMQVFAETTIQTIHRDFSSVPGAGAAGGLGFCLQSFLRAELLPGIETTIQLGGLEHKISDYDLLITGEGRLDEQSGKGKVPWGILGLGQKANIPVVCICGQNKLDQQTGFEHIFAIVPDIASSDDSMGNPEYFLRMMIRKRLIKWLKAR